MNSSYHQDKVSPWFYHASKLALKILLYIFTRLEVKGQQNIPNQGPLLVIANHLSLADPPLLNIYLGREVKFMAKAKLFRFRILGYFFRSLGAFPVRQGKPDRQALRQAEQVLSEDAALVIFPEGMRSRRARLQRPFSGATLVAFRSGVPILPVGLTGTEKLENPLWWFLRPRITINVGHPFHLPPVDGRLTRAGLDGLTDYIMERVAELLPEEYRGTYARKIRWH